MKILSSIVPIIIMGILVNACNPQVKMNPSPSPRIPTIPPIYTPTLLPSPLPSSIGTSLPPHTPTPTPTDKPTLPPTAIVLGPENFPANINPLNGLPVKNPDSLLLPPALISITNSPLGARPQAGLSFSPLVYELFIGEGTTRFLALFYGDYPEAPPASGISVDEVKVGPIRSGRLPYESLRRLFNGFLVFASAASRVLANLNDYAIVYGTDDVDVNDAFITTGKLRKVAEEEKAGFDPESLAGQRFDSNPIPGGKLANMLWIPYNFRAQVIWRYEPTSGSYSRFQDQIDGLTFVQSTDRINGENLAFENVIVLFSDITFYDQTYFDIQLLGIKNNPALLLRDGRMYDIRWTTYTDSYSRRTGHLRRMRFIDVQGNAIALKPGQTWVEIVSRGSPVYETVDTLDYWQKSHRQVPGSGNWAVRFIVPTPDPDESSHPQP